MRTHNRTGLWLVVGLAAALVGSGLTTAVASGKRHHRHRPITFSGSCQGSATVTFEPPLTNTPQTITQHARGAVTCSGSLVDRRGRTHQLSNARVLYLATEQGDDVSCPAGVDSGPGALHTHWGNLRFTVSEKRAAALATLSFAGANGGSATGVAHPTDDPATVVAQCGGSGLKQAHVDATVSADSLSG